MLKDKLAKLKGRMPAAPKAEGEADDLFADLGADAPPDAEAPAGEAASEDPFAEAPEGEGEAGDPALASAMDEDLVKELEKRGFKVEPPAAEAAEGEAPESDPFA